MAVPAAVRDACDAAATLLKTFPGASVDLGTCFVERGFKENPEYDADGPDGTAFAEVRIGCVANGPAAPEKP